MTLTVTLFDIPYCNRFIPLSPFLVTASGHTSKMIWITFTEACFLIAWQSGVVPSVSVLFANSGHVDKMVLTVSIENPFSIAWCNTVGIFWSCNEASGNTSKTFLIRSSDASLSIAHRKGKFLLLSCTLAESGHSAKTALSTSAGKSFAIPQQRGVAPLSSLVFAASGHFFKMEWIILPEFRFSIA